MANKTITTGNFGQTPQLVQLPGGTLKTEFSLGVKDRIKNAQTGEYEDSTDWIDFEAFGKNAENICKFCQKGHKLYVEGKLKKYTWKDKDTGGNRSRSVIRVEEFEFLTPKTESSSVQQPAPQAMAQPAQPVMQQPAPTVVQSAQPVMQQPAVNQPIMQQPAPQVAQAMVQQPAAQPMTSHPTASVQPDNSRPFG